MHNVDQSSGKKNCGENITKAKQSNFDGKSLLDVENIKNRQITLITNAKVNKSISLSFDEIFL